MHLKTDAARRHWSPAVQALGPGGDLGQCWQEQEASSLVALLSLTHAVTLDKLLPFSWEKGDYQTILSLKQPVLYSPDCQTVKLMTKKNVLSWDW